MSHHRHTDPARMSVFDWAEHLGFSRLEHQHHLPHGLLTSLIRQESFGRNDVVSPAGAIGIFQIMPRLARHYHIDAHDPHQASRVAATELGLHLHRYHGSLDMALAAYNYGHGNVMPIREHHGRHHWKEHLPAETQTYITNITGDLAADAAIRTIRHNHRDASPERLDHLLFGNHAIARLVRRRLDEHGYDAGRAGHTTDARMHAALRQFEQTMEDRDIHGASGVFHNDSKLDFASLNMMICRTPGIKERLDNPHRSH